MTNLHQFWKGEEGNTPQVTFWKKALVTGFLLGAITFVLGRGVVSNLPKLPRQMKAIQPGPIVELPEDVVFPQMTFDANTLLKLEYEQASPSTQLQLLSANAIGLYEPVNQQKGGQRRAAAPPPEGIGRGGVGDEPSLTPEPTEQAASQEEEEVTPTPQEPTIQPTPTPSEDTSQDQEIEKPDLKSIPPSIDEKPEENMIDKLDDKPDVKKPDKRSSQKKQQVKFTGLRILGEVKNVGSQTVTEVTPILRFFDQDRRLVATKIGNFNEGYTFLPLAPGEITVYDILVPNPIQSATISIEFRPSLTSKNPPEDRVTALKIKNKSLEPKKVDRGGGERTHYTFSGILVNTAEFDIIKPGVYVWLKNDQGRVFGLDQKTYEDDLLEAGEEMEVKFLVAPLTRDEFFSFEVKTFATKL